MDSLNLALIELDRKDWSGYRDVRAICEDPVVSSDYVSETIKALFRATDPDEIERLYWQIENHVVVQGSTFEAAEHLLPVLVASLHGLGSSQVRIRILELIFQMVAYSPHRSEIEIGNTGLTERCKMRAREGLWEFYRILMNGEPGERDAAREILEVIETEPERLAAFIEASK